MDLKKMREFKETRLREKDTEKKIEELRRLYTGNLGILNEDSVRTIRQDKAAGLPMAFSGAGYANRKLKEGAETVLDNEPKTEEDFMEDLGRDMPTPMEVMEKFGIPAKHYQEIADIMGQARLESIKRNMP
jgi:hypothetical protein